MDLIELKSDKSSKQNDTDFNEFNSLLKELNLTSKQINQKDSMNQIVNCLKDMNFFISDKPKIQKEEFDNKDSLIILRKNLQNFFENFDIKSNLFVQMTSNQKDFFLGLLKNKFLLSDDLKGIKFKSRIRKENKSKYIVKKGIKFLFKKFKEKNNCFIKGKKILDEEEFYFYYFKCLQDQKYPLESVYLPGNKLSQKSMKNPTFRTINIDYLNIIFKSKPFKKDFLDYLDNHFMSSQQKERNQKIDAIIDKFQNKIHTQKIKLPWTDTELQDAQKLLKQLIANFKD